MPLTGCTAQCGRDYAIGGHGYSEYCCQVDDLIIRRSRAPETSPARPLLLEIEALHPAITRHNLGSSLGRLYTLRLVAGHLPRHQDGQQAGRLVARE